MSAFKKGTVCCCTCSHVLPKLASFLYTSNPASNYFLITKIKIISSHLMCFFFFFVKD